MAERQSGRFMPGERPSPATEIQPGQRLSPATEFKKGERAHNKLPVGTVRIRTFRGVQRAWVKVAEPNKWRERAKVVWEEHNGRPVPRGYTIHHRDRDPLNDAPENLQALTRADHAKEHAADRLPGEGHPSAILTEALVAEARRRAAAGEQIKAIAHEKGVGYAALNAAVAGRTWKHITDPRPVRRGGPR